MSEDDDIVLGRPGHEPGDAGTPLWHENQRKAMEEMNAGLADQLRATPMSEAQPETVAGLGYRLDALLDELVVAGWEGEFDARERAALNRLGWVREAEARAAGAARYEAALDLVGEWIAGPLAAWVEKTPGAEAIPLPPTDALLAAAPLAEQGDGLDVERLAFVRVLKAAWELTHSSGSGHYVRAFDDLREAVLAATPSRPAEQGDGLDVDEALRRIAKVKSGQWSADALILADVIAEVLSDGRVKYLAPAVGLTPSRPAEERKP